METGFYKKEEIIVDYNKYDLEHKDKNGNILYIEHINEPIKEVKEVWVEYTEDEILERLRTIRELECFSVINQNYIIDGQSKTWFDTLTEEQKQEASVWVQGWRDVTETKVVPTKPSWLN